VGLFGGGMSEGGGGGRFSSSKGASLVRAHRIIERSRDRIIERSRGQGGSSSGSSRGQLR
jgi:hypothetical protein